MKIAVEEMCKYCGLVCQFQLCILRVILLTNIGYLC